MADLGLAMLDSLDSQVQFVFVMLRLAFVLCTPISQDPQQRNLVRLKEGQNTIIEHICRRDGMFGLVQLRKGYPAIGVDKGLLVNAANALRL